MGRKKDRLWKHWSVYLKKHEIMCYDRLFVSIFEVKLQLQNAPDLHLDFKISSPEPPYNWVDFPLIALLLIPPLNPLSALELGCKPWWVSSSLSVHWRPAAKGVGALSAGHASDGDGLRGGNGTRCGEKQECVVCGVCGSAVKWVGIQIPWVWFDPLAGQGEEVFVSLRVESALVQTRLLPADPPFLCTYIRARTQICLCAR